jgi:hypothetical protein
MARMTDANLAFVPELKIAGYLADPNHERGWPKGKFLMANGFDLEDHAAIRAALVDHANTHDAIVRPTPYGIKYEVDGPMQTPTGVTIRVRTVWVVEAGIAAPRFVTLRPL